MQFAPDTHQTQFGKDATLTETHAQNPSYHALIDALLVALPAQVALLDRRGTIVAVNEAWKRFARDKGVPGLAKGSIGMDYLALCRRTFGLSREEAHEVEVGIRAVLDGTQPSFTSRCPYELPDERRWILLQVRSLPEGMGGALVLQLDITDLELAEPKLAEMLVHTQTMHAEPVRGALGPNVQQTMADEHAKDVHLRAMQTLTDTALSRLGLEDLLHQLLGRMVAVMDVNDVAALVLDTADETLTIQAAQGPAEAVVGKMKVPVGQGFAGRIAASKRPLIADDFSTFEEVPQEWREKLSSVVGVPMMVGDQLVGVVQVGSATPRHFTEADVQLLQLVADRIALAIERARLYDAERDSRARAEEAQARARESEAHATERAERLQAIIETIADGIAVTDKDGHIIQTNHAYRELFDENRIANFDNVPSVPQNVSVQVPSSGSELVLDEHHSKASASRGETERSPHANLSMRARDGRELEVNTSEVPLRDHSGSIAGAVVVARDMTWRKRLELEREEAHANEQASQEMTQRMDEFLATASHDLRSPLTVAVGTIDLAATRFDRLIAVLPPVAVQEPDVADKVTRVRDCLVEAGRSVDRLSRLVDVLFDLSQARTGTLELRRQSCDVVSVVREQVEAARIANPQRTIQLDVSSNEPIQVFADADRIGEVVMNYLSNALKYSAEDQPIVVRAAADDKLAHVVVRDHGPGVPSNERKRIWHRFYQIQGNRASSSSKDGLGLGLHICKTIVEGHGGQVGVDGAPGGGAIFWFTLPLEVR